MIYRYVLSGNVLRQLRTGYWRSLKMKFLLPFSKRDWQTPEDIPDQKNWLSLLSTCRQIYNDICLLPFMWNSFSVTFLRHICPLLEKVGPEQRRKITTIQVEVVVIRGVKNILMSGYPHAPHELFGLSSRLSSLLPSIKSHCGG